MELSDAQQRIVEQGAPVKLRVSPDQLPVVWSQRTEHRAYGERSMQLAPGVAPPIAGYCEVYELGGQWFAYRESPGGSSRDRASTVDLALANLCLSVSHSMDIWDRKVRWRENGDLTDGDRFGRGRHPVIRVDGEHYTIAPDLPSRDRSMAGHAGRLFRFRMLADDREVVSRNVWFQGIIPAEYREALPDNAVWVRQ